MPFGKILVAQSFVFDTHVNNNSSDVNVNKIHCVTQAQQKNLILHEIKQNTLIRKQIKFLYYKRSNKIHSQENK